MIRRPPASRSAPPSICGDRIDLIRGDLLDPDSLRQRGRDVRPDELYHLAAPSFVPDSWRRPGRDVRRDRRCRRPRCSSAVRDRRGETRVFVAGSGAMFGAAPRALSARTRRAARKPRTRPRSSPPTSWSGQLRAHDGSSPAPESSTTTSPSAGPNRLLRARSRARRPRSSWAWARQVVLGDLSAVRDWSFAGDIVRGAWLMLQQERAGRLYSCQWCRPHGRRVRGGGVRACRPGRRPYIRVDHSADAGPAKRPSGRRPEPARVSYSAGSRRSASSSWSTAWSTPAPASAQHAAFSPTCKLSSESDPSTCCQYSCNFVPATGVFRPDDPPLGVAARLVCGCGNNRVVPLWMGLFAFDLDSAHPLIGDLDPGGVGAGVQSRVDLQTGGGRSRGDQVDHGLAAFERLGAPVDRDVGEQPVLDFVPLRCARRDVTGPRLSVHHG